MKAPPLQRGDTIALVAPASWSDQFLTINALLEERGYQVKLPSNQEGRFFYLAGSDQERAEALMEAWKDPKVKAIWCIRGGYGSGRILDLLDYSWIKKHPKIFIGMSDITALHGAFLKKTDLVTFLGPVASWEAGADLWERLEGGKKGLCLNPNQPKALVPGKCVGKLVGGNLSLIASQIGTPWQLETKNKILLLEDVNEKLFRIDRMLTQLSQAGMVDELSGLILASWKGCEGEEGDTIERLCAQFFSSAPFPVLFGFPSGHIENQLTLPLNCLYELDADELRVTLLESGVEMAPERD